MYHICSSSQAREIIGGKTESETRFYISSLAADAERQADAIRCQWGVESSHHWVMDMVFRDNECRIRKDNVPVNFAPIKHIAGNLMSCKAGKHPLCVKRRLAAWNDYLASLIAAGKPSPDSPGDAAAKVSGRIAIVVAALVRLLHLFATALRPGGALTQDEPCRPVS